VVGVSVPAVRPETDHHLGPELPDELHDLAHQASEVGFGEGAVDVIPAPHVRHAQPLARQAQLGLADRGDRAPGRHAGVPDLARLPPGGGDHHDLGAVLGVAGERPARAERLVVRMGEYPEQPG
jgi:hypothetical protein